MSEPVNKPAAFRRAARSRGCLIRVSQTSSGSQAVCCAPREELPSFDSPPVDAGRLLSFFPSIRLMSRGPRFPPLQRDWRLSTVARDVCALSHRRGDHRGGRSQRRDLNLPSILPSPPYNQRVSTTAAPFDLDSFLAALPAKPGVYRMLAG